ncbi:MAG: methyl-accepting chemotaxis protein [Pseudomonadota bacterium]
MNLSVGTKIATGYFLALAILAILGVASYQNTTKLVETAQWRVHTHQVLSGLKDIYISLESAETGQRGFIITGDEHYLEGHQKGIAELTGAIKNIRRLTLDNVNQQHRLDVLEPLVATRIALLNENTMRQKNGAQTPVPTVASRLAKGTQVMDDVHNVIAEMENEENQLLLARENEVKAQVKTMFAMIVYGIPLAFVLLTLTGFMAIRSITRQLRESSNHLSAVSSQILAITVQISAGAAQTAAAVTETTITVEEVKQTAQLANQKARYVADSAQKAMYTSQAGRSAVNDAIQGMQHIQEQMEFIAESIVRLSEQSQAIDDIVASVNDLAEQSNLLAVNAAIEAAKAGEQGKGFAVVAQEVKSLAEQSKQATARVRSILKDIQKATSAAVLATEQGNKAVASGSKQSAQSGESIRLLSESIGEAAQAATQIAASSQQQMVGMDQVVQAMDNIKQASVQNVTGTRQAEEAAQSLHALGQRLKAMTGGK